MREIQILTLTLILSLAFNCVAQSVIPSNAKSIMTSNDWIITGFEDHTYKVKFTNTKMIITIDGNLIGENKYYLSDNLNDCRLNGFNEDNVGSPSSGAYIIAEKSCFELLVVNNNELKFKSLYGSDQRYITVAHPE